MTTFDRWELAARQALVDRGIGYREATPMIEEARAHHADSGQDPWEALGSPDDFASGVADAYPVELSRRDTQGKTPRDHMRDGLFVAAFLGLPVAVFGGVVVGSWTLPVTVAGLTGSVLAALAAVSTQVPGAVRAAGRPRLAPWTFAIFAVLVIAAATAFTGLPRTRVGELPVLALLAVSLGAMWLLTREPSGRRSDVDQLADDGRIGGKLGVPDGGDRLSGNAGDQLLGGAGDGGAGDRSLEGASEQGVEGAGDQFLEGADDQRLEGAGRQGFGAEGAEAWFSRLRALLVGRFDVPPRRADELVEQARAHVAASGARPRDEFGSPAGYARELAEAEPARQGPWWRGDTAELVISVVITGWIVVISVDAAVNGQWWLAALGVLCLLGIGPQAWRRVRK
ncbi:hypothetical protein [Actinoplanes sp. NPDC023714]|uniref:hypothetical protein n=1 Tax=Actinoplanes sp. NPDC023714 TaxID=3154322 RepID=UPI0033C1F121